MDIFNFLKDNAAEILQALSMIIAGASVLANFTKTDTDNKALGIASRAVNFMAGNFFAIKIKSK